MRSDKAEISELCGADHLNDPVILGRWLANKTPEIVASRISRPGNSVLVAVENDTILAVGSVTDTGGAHAELCLAGREIPWSESRSVGRARN